MQHLFVYGSLLFAELVEKLTGAKFRSVPAVLPDFRRFAVKGCDYPAIIPENNTKTEGRLILNVDDESMKILAFFEGGDYIKKGVEVLAGSKKYEAIAFVWDDDLSCLEECDWDITNFRETSLQFYVEKVARETVKEFRDSRI
jgi:gamma-glutamylcyclotransferase (GGCT)/AIG2-like uncharacterized protein YtfP